MKKAQTIFEYFVLFGVLAAVLVMSSGAFNSTVKGKLIEYRDFHGDKIVKADGDDSPATGEDSEEGDNNSGDTGDTGNSGSTGNGSTVQEYCERQCAHIGDITYKTMCINNCLIS